MTSAPSAPEMGEEQLAELDRLVKTATPSPWKAILWSNPQWAITGPNGEFHCIALTSQGNDAANAAFIAAARTAVPMLLSAYRRIVGEMYRTNGEFRDALVREGQMIDERDAVLARRDAALRERDEARAALEMIAGKRQCPDSLMSNVDIALAALAGPAAQEEGKR